MPAVEVPLKPNADVGVPGVVVVNVGVVVQNQAQFERLRHRDNIFTRCRTPVVAHYRTSEVGVGSSDHVADGVSRSIEVWVPHRTCYFGVKTLPVGVFLGSGGDATNVRPSDVVEFAPSSHDLPVSDLDVHAINRVLAHAFKANCVQACVVNCLVWTVARLANVLEVLAHLETHELSWGGGVLVHDTTRAGDLPRSYRSERVDECGRAQRADVPERLVPVLAFGKRAVTRRQLHK